MVNAFLAEVVAFSARVLLFAVLVPLWLYLKQMVLALVLPPHTYQQTQIL